LIPVSRTPAITKKPPTICTRVSGVPSSTVMIAVKTTIRLR